MKSKRGPFILVSLLLIVLVFVVGVRYGQRVEMTNKAVSIILSTTPAGPTATKAPLRFNTFTNKACGLEMLQPSTVDLIKQSSTEARLSTGSTLLVAVSCETKPTFESFFNDNSASSQRITFQKRSYQARVKVVENAKYLYFSLQNPIMGKPLHIAVEEKLFPLVESSLIFK